MTWHLKDRELEKKLIEMCPNFIECIEDAIQTKEKDTNYIDVEFDREREGDIFGFNYLYFWDDELEDIPEYNPKAWNDSRKVTPPEGVVFRAKIHRVFYREIPYVDYECLTYKDGRWYKVRDGKARPVCIDFNPGDYIDFRAWED